MAGINEPLNRKLRMALIGGGGDAFIGRVHWFAATLDHRAELVAGCLSSRPDKAKLAAPEFGIDSDRAYTSYQELLDGEHDLPDGQRADFVSIATPNFTHFEIAMAALRAGFHVMCDKPMTIEIDQAKQLVECVRKTGRVFVLTHNYTGYPMVRQAAEMIRSGELGTIQAIRANYIQGWLRGVDPNVEPSRGAWKSDPAKAGSGTLGDLATHAYNLARFMTVFEPLDVSCQLRTFAPDRVVDDYGHAQVRLSGDALAMITFSQVTHGRLNDLSIEIDGTKGSLQWRQEQPNEMIVRRYGKPVEIYERHPGAPYTNEFARGASRIPGGHPEAFIEAFANVYRDGFDDMVAHATDQAFGAAETSYPNVVDGEEGVRFIHACLSSHESGGDWMSI